VQRSQVSPDRLYGDVELPGKRIGGRCVFRTHSGEDCLAPLAGQHDVPFLPGLD
jgi:hypothetical protein